MVTTIFGLIYIAFSIAPNFRSLELFTVFVFVFLCGLPEAWNYQKQCILGNTEQTVSARKE